MKNKLPPFIEMYRALIATPSISATEEALDQSNADLITLLADWFKDLGSPYGWWVLLRSSLVYFYS